MDIPMNELGHPGGITATYDPRTSGKRYAVTSAADLARELQFPESLVVYDAMRVETQLAGVLEAISQPIAGADWHLEGEGVPDNVMEFVRTELGLIAPDSPLSRIRHNGVNIRDHIAEMVDTMLWAGFATAEQVYDVAPPTPAQAGLGLPAEVRHLRKLAPRPPRTITRIETERDGGLRGIRQTALDFDTPTLEDTFIPVEALVFYTLKRRGANWAGESVLRPAYRPWALKDIYLRLDAQAVDKHSSGYWRGTSVDKNRADKLFLDLSEARSGDRGVIITDPSDTVELLGLQGSTIDITPRLNYLDQQMSRSALAMFLDLGHDNGARSLGETHLRVFYTKVAAIAEHIGRVVTDHVIYDLVRHNFPDGTPYPALSPGDVIAQQGASSTTIKELMDAGAITYDRSLEDHVRGRHGVPALPAPEEVEDDSDLANLERERAEADVLKSRVEAAGGVFRMGYDPAGITTAFKLPPELQHLGYLPTTIKTAAVSEVEDDVARAEARAKNAEAAVKADSLVNASEMSAVQRATAAYQELMARVGGSSG